MTELIKLTQDQHEFIQTFTTGDYTDLELLDKQKAVYYISRWGFGFSLTDGKGEEYASFNQDGEKLQAPFNQDECFKIIDAIINGYEVIEPRYRLFAQPYNEVTYEIEKMYFLGSDIRPRAVPNDKKLKEDFNKTFSLNEACKIKDEFEKLGLILYIEEI